MQHRSWFCNAADLAELSDGAEYDGCLAPEADDLSLMSGVAPFLAASPPPGCCCCCCWRPWATVVLAATAAGEELLAASSASLSCLEVEGSDQDRLASPKTVSPYLAADEACCSVGKSLSLSGLARILTGSGSS